ERPDIWLCHITPECSSSQSGKNPRGTWCLLFRTRGLADKNAPLARCLADSFCVIRTGNLDAVQRGRTRLSRERGFPDTNATDVEQLHTTAVHAELDGWMNRRTARIERTSKRRTALSGHIRNRTFALRELVRKRDGHGVGARFHFHSHLKESDSFRMR